MNGVRPLALLALGAAMTACGDSRPSDEAWAAEGERERALVPDAPTIVAGGRPLCDELVGQLRSSAGKLTPTPTEALDDAVREWIRVAENIAFDCPQDPADLGERVNELERSRLPGDSGVRDGDDPPTGVCA